MIVNKTTAPKPAPLAAPFARRPLIPLVAFALALFTLTAGGYYALRYRTTPTWDEEQEAPPQNQPNFQNWQKPLLAIVVSGQMHGYTDPCGCSHPQYGGLERRYNFIQSLRAKGWDVIGMDLGEIVSRQGIPAQNVYKFELSMKALSLMNYRAIGMGKNEILTPLGPALAQTWDKNRPHPRPLALSLDQTAPGELYHGLNVRPYEIVSAGKNGPTLGILSMLGPDLRDDLNNQEKFLKNDVELPKALGEFAKANVDIGIVLHHEYPKLPADFKGIQAIQVLKMRKDMAKKCAEFCENERKRNSKVPPIELMMMLTDEPEPPGVLTQLDAKLPPQVVEIGHKGIYVGLIGVYRDKAGYRFEYQIVKMSPDWATPEAKKPGHPIVKLTEDYLQQLKRENMLAKYPRSILHFNQHPLPNQKGLRATYVGSERCGDCHDHAYKVWSTVKSHDGKSHFIATETLEKEKNPFGRHYDPECMKCHVTGFQHPGGYNDLVQGLANWPNVAKPNAQQLEKHNKVTRGVGCESCHGPASEHVKDPDNKVVRDMINPYRATKEERDLAAQLEKNPQNKNAQDQLRKLLSRKFALNQSCMNCHDNENDVHWGKPGKELFDKWIGSKLYHHTPKNNNGAANPPGNNVPEATTEPLPFRIEVLDEKKK